MVYDIAGNDMMGLHVVFGSICTSFSFYLLQLPFLVWCLVAYLQIFCALDLY